MRRMSCAAGLLLVMTVAAALNFLRAHYDAETDELVVEIAYRGSNPDHRFSLRWEECKPYTGEGVDYQVAALVEDSQWDDRALEDFRQTVRFSLEGVTCRPARVTLHSPAGFVWTVDVPAAPGTDERA